jgi:hypothetical protein
METNMDGKHCLQVIRYQVDPKKEAVFNDFYTMKVENFLRSIPTFRTGRRYVTERNGIKEFYCMYDLDISTEAEAKRMMELMPDTDIWAYFRENTLSGLQVDTCYPILFEQRADVDPKKEWGDPVKRPLLILKYQVDPKQEKAFNEWYAAYMTRFMSRVPEMRYGVRYEAAKNGIKQFFSIYEIESEEAVPRAMANIVQDTPERIKDSEKWHEWEHSALSYLDDAVFHCLQYEDKESIQKLRSLW